MSMINIENEKATITLPQKICIDQLADLHKQLDAIELPDVKQVCVDAIDLEEIDFAGLQVLASLKRKLSEGSMKLGWENIPISMFEAAVTLDFCAELEM